MDLANKVVVITGGASGLGLSLSKAFIKEGAFVHILSRNVETHKIIETDLGSNSVKTHKVDVTNYQDIEKVIENIPQIDILINNAGIWLEGQLQNNSPEDISKVIDVNTKGVIFTTKAVLPKMLEKNSGFILNISSTSGLKSRDNQSVYVASKYAVTGFTDSLKEDLKKTNIKVAGFYPGGMNTKMFEKSGNPKDNSDWMDTDKVAQIIVFMIKQDDTMILDHVVLNKRGTKLSH